MRARNYLAAVVARRNPHVLSSSSASASSVTAAENILPFSRFKLQTLRCFASASSPINNIKNPNILIQCKNNKIITPFVHIKQQRQTQSTLAASAAYQQSIDSFPSIVIGPHRSIVPQGSFAQAQAEVRSFVESVLTTTTTNTNLHSFRNDTTLTFLFVPF